MTSKALRKQLLAAVAMVIVAAIAVSSSTFAWFAGNNVVTAKEMKVQAVAEGGIEIKENSQAESAYSTVNAAAVATAMTLFPTSTANATNWAHASAAAASAFTAAAGSYEMLALSAGNAANDIYGTSDPQNTTQFYDANGKQYYRYDKFQIRTVKGTQAAQKVVVKDVEVTGAPAALDKSLKVLIKATSTDSSDSTAKTIWYIYNAGGSGNNSRNVAAAVNANGNPSSISVATYLAAGTASGGLLECPAASNTAAGTPVDVEIFIYYEGEDNEHYSNNITAAALAELNVTVNFQVNDSATFTATSVTTSSASAEQAAGTTAIN